MKMIIRKNPPNMAFDWPFERQLDDTLQRFAVTYETHAVNLPCRNCKHEHERSHYDGNSLRFSPCKVWTTTPRTEQWPRVPQEQLLCKCEVRA